MCIRDRDQAVQNSPIVVFVLGGPGSGKGTQCELIVKNFGFKHLSAGDLLREERKSGSQQAELIEDYIRNGKIVPSEITVQLLEKAMQKHGWENGKFLIDGFPRNEENCQKWLNLCGNKVNTPFLLQLECSEETMEKRILKRAETSGRSDDNIEEVESIFCQL
eukprot:TRINITY_DN2161_c0_g1_i4.p1 TRINITY_DN2161_c0_g1~~TRINITY_DN2161_c0_g1_i4.p1  ORF type:complete len:163 (-),score=35.51 TRINITY_DN2161_c0_g1_i4:14-502(-)